MNGTAADIMWHIENACAPMSAAERERVLKQIVEACKQRLAERQRRGKTQWRV